MKQAYAPGCALMVYKPDLAMNIYQYLKVNSGDMPYYSGCCRKQPLLADTRIINTCAGCDRRYRELYRSISTISLWEVLAASKTFPFPDYQGAVMTIHDACPTRTEYRVHQALRELLAKMNISIIEPERTRTKASCCGDKFYGILPVNQVKEQMKRRASEMPCENVVVYCVSCIKAMHVGGKQPRYIIDLLFNQSTEAGTSEPHEWHRELQRYIDQHL